jgi:diguanylate cyclase (GGDEF)-like protein/PAS domain S-box-containing protein
MATAPTILVLARNIGGFYHGELLAGVVRQVAAAGGRVIVAETLDPGSELMDWRSTPAFHLPLAWDAVDAVVCVAFAGDPEYLRRARAAGKPVVLANHVFEGFDAPVALPDNHGGIRSAVEHLITHGHTRIGFVGCMEQHDFRVRLAAYRETMADHGLPAGDDLFFETTSYSQAGGAAAAEAFLAVTDRPTALVAANDENALGLMAALTDAGLSLPEDLAVIGFDDIEEGAFAVPSLSSVGQRFKEVGALAGRLALSWLAGEETPMGAYTVDAAFLMLRASCGCRYDLVDVRPGRRTQPVLTPRARIRAGVHKALVGLFPESQATVIDARCTRAVDLLDLMLTTRVEPTGDDVQTIMRALTDLTSETEMLQQVASVLDEYARQVVTGNERYRPGPASVLGILAELAARGYMHRSRRHEASVIEMDTIAVSLLRADGARNRSLAWLADTHVRAGVLAMWEGPVEEGNLRIAGVHDPSGLLDAHVGQLTNVRRFPPPTLVDAPDGLADEMCVVVPVATLEHHLGLLALVGEIDTTATRETYYYWAEMLFRAFEGDELQNAVRTSEERYALAVRAANDGLWEWYVDSRALYLSPQCRDLLGIAAGAELDLMDLFRDVHPDDLPALTQAVDAAHKKADTPVETECRVVGRDGVAHWMLVRVLGVAGEDGVVRRLVGSVSDIDRRKSLEEQLLQAALFDFVTGLPNRRLFLEHLEMAMAHLGRRKKARFAVLFLDLDGFKLINDSLGHLMGDELLRIVGDRLRCELRSVDTAARIGGDEFALLLADPVPEDLLVVARRIQQRIAAPTRLADQEVWVTASIGIAVSETGYTSAEDVLRDADIAMYQAKEGERGTACLFDPGMHERALERLRTRSALTAALEDHQFVVHYQPIVDLDGGELTRFEALVRWDHPEQGLLLPKDFLPHMEGNATILTLGHQVLDTVCAQIALWRADQHTVSVSINLSHRQFWEPDLVEGIRSTLDRYQVPPECLAIEITESVIMAEPTEARAIMDALHGLGLRLHIDNFGSGHSSLNVLRVFPVDGLKIDGSFVRELGVVAETTALVRTVVSMGDALGVDVVAECVETTQQADELRTMGCTAVQGWLYAEAQPAADAGLVLGTRLAEQAVTGEAASSGS